MYKKLAILMVLVLFGAGIIATTAQCAENNALQDTYDWIAGWSWGTSCAKSSASSCQACGAQCCENCNCDCGGKCCANCCVKK